MSDWETRVAEPFRAFVQNDIRTWPLLQRFVLPWKWFDSSASVKALAALLEQKLTRLKLSELPDAPEFLFCATDLAFGVNWTFGKTRVGDYQIGYAGTPPDWTVARAVAASACFPPFFNPLPVGLPSDRFTAGAAKRSLPPAEYARLVAGTRLNDGGTYDNMGLEPVWKRCETVLVSDGGSPFSFEPDRGLFPRLMRYFAIVNNQARAVRKRWLIAGFQTQTMRGTYWGVGSHVSSYHLPGALGYSDDLVNEVISPMRTDFNRFREAEIAVLENHGYLLADVAMRRHVSQLLPASSPTLNIPHPFWMDESRVRNDLS